MYSRMTEQSHAKAHSCKISEHPWVNLDSVLERNSRSHTYGPWDTNSIRLLLQKILEQCQHTLKGRFQAEFHIQLNY